jgi:uncharacterized membrane protein YedE/YeeE
MLTVPWPWWLAAVVLAAVSLLHWRLSGRLMGGSGAWISLVNLPEELRAAKEEEGLDDEAALQAAMLAATLAEFGPAALPVDAAAPPPLPAVPEAPAVVAPLGRSPWTAHLVFVLALALGGAVASLLRHGRLTWRTSMGDTFERMYGHGPGSLLMLLAGGLLVGFGVRMAGGCTVGHGLNGCSRLQRGSLLSIAVFFSVGIGVALVLSQLTGVR